MLGLAGVIAIEDNGAVSPVSLPTKFSPVTSASFIAIDIVVGEHVYPALVGVML